jgi:hypothetical protein
MGELVDILTGKQELYWRTARIVGVNAAKNTYAVLHDEARGLVNCSVDPAFLRRPAPCAFVSQKRFSSPVVNAAYIASVEAAVAMAALRPLAGMLIKFAGTQLVAGQHVWMRDASKALIPVMTRHRIEQIDTLETRSALMISPDPMPAKGAVLERAAVATPAMFLRVVWQLAPDATRLDFVPAFSEIIEAGLDDAMLVRAICAAFSSTRDDEGPPLVL